MPMFNSCIIFAFLFFPIPSLVFWLEGFFSIFTFVCAREFQWFEAFLKSQLNLFSNKLKMKILLVYDGIACYLKLGNLKEISRLVFSLTLEL